ncbi:flagellin [Anaeroarcus burkinensis]|uniref:flagellin N-terminal helical domain-containing protein n=1 Tax=Anaeroarcus burkinensis TaxID=82376 RepID=UPI00040F7FDD|nr:flagellin [Anaeroarcus burkinensis]
MIINHNMMAMNTYNKLSSNNASASKSLEKLSSGLRINRAADDASGLAISEKMRGQIRGLDQGTSNAQNGISLIQTAEGALTETHSILQRMRELAVQSANDTNTTSDRTEIQKEINQLTDEVDRIANTTEFNTKTLMNGGLTGVQASVAATYNLVSSDAAVSTSLSVSSILVGLGASASDTVRVRLVTKDTINSTYVFSTASSLGIASITLATNGSITLNAGSVATIIGTYDFADMQAGDTLTFSLTGAATAVSTDNSLHLQVGANTAQEITIGLNDMQSQALGIKNGATYMDVSSQFGAEASITRIDSAIQKVSSERSKMGAVQNRLEHTINNLTTASENISSAESRIRDVDMAKEMMNYQKTSILQQAATSMLAQANQQPQNVLKLLQ